MRKKLLLFILGSVLILGGCTTARIETTPGESRATGENTKEVTATEEVNTPEMATIPVWTKTVEPTLTATPVLGTDYFVAADGKDTNAGNINAPFKTFAKGVSMLEPGDALHIRGGTYNERLVVDVSGEMGKPITIRGYAEEEVVLDMEGQNISGVSLNGDHIQLTGLEVRGSDRACVEAKGNHQQIWGLRITDCFSSGIQLSGGNIEFFGNQVYGAVLRNENGEGGSWNSAVKVLVGGHDLVIRENEVFENWGEGIAVTRGARVKVQENVVYDNWASNIYIDNSYDVIVERNFSYCTENAPLAKDGYPANAFGIGEEEYEGWGAQLARVTLINNIGAFCKRGIGSWSAEVAEGGLDTVLIMNNTFWGNRLHGIGIYVNETPVKARNTFIQNNIFHQSENEHGYIEDHTGITLDYNFWVGEPPPNYKHLTGPHDLWGPVGMMEEPGFVPETFRLDVNSQAIGNGLWLDVIVEDFFGQERDEKPDMGAIEFGDRTSHFKPSLVAPDLHQATANQHFSTAQVRGEIEIDDVFFILIPSLKFSQIYQLVYFAAAALLPFGNRAVRFSQPQTIMPNHPVPSGKN
jgi:hypothetical protein